MKKSGITSTVAVASILAGIATSWATASDPIEQLVSEDAVFVMGVRNVSQLMDRVKDSDVYRFVQHDEIRDLWKEAFDDLAEGLAAWYSKVGLEEGALQPPTGAAGLAVVVVMNQELGTAEPALLLYGDWGENADSFADVIDHAMRDAEREGELKYEESDLLGRKVFTFILEDEEEIEEFDHFDDFGDPFGDPFDAFGGFTRMHMVREGSRFLLSSDIDVLGGVLDRIDGKVQHGLADRDDFRAVLNQIGGTEHNDLYAAFLTRDMRRLMSGPDMMMVDMMIGMLRPVFGEFGGAGMAVRFDEATSILESRMSIYLPRGKEGLFSLFDVQAPRADLPGFVGENTSSYFAAEVHFDRVIDVVTNIVRSNPFLAMEIEPMLAEVGPIIEEITGSLGPRMHMVTEISQPITRDSSSSIMVMECRDTQRFENAISGFAPMIGLEPRDFLGHRVYSTPPGMFAEMMPFDPDMAELTMSVGIGGGYVTVGESAEVENVLRAISDGGEGRLADSDLYRRAVAVLPDERFVAWGFSDIALQMQYSIVELEAEVNRAGEHFREFDPEFADRLRRDAEEQARMMRVIARIAPDYFGPVSWYWKPVNDGFVGVYYSLPPER